MAQRSQIVQHSICQVAGDMRLMNPVSLMENHPLCRKNRAGQSVLPNEQGIPFEYANGRLENHAQIQIDI